jgi:hypothetical protein
MDVWNAGVVLAVGVKKHITDEPRMLPGGPSTVHHGMTRVGWHKRSVVRLLDLPANDMLHRGNRLCDRPIAHIAPSILRVSSTALRTPIFLKNNFAMGFDGSPTDPQFLGNFPVAPAERDQFANRALLCCSVDAGIPPSSCRPPQKPIGSPSIGKSVSLTAFSGSSTDRRTA